MDINLLAVLAAAISAFVLGGIWYAPPVFGTAWQREAGVDIADSNPLLIFGGAFALTLLAAFAFAIFLGPRPELSLGVGAGFAAGSCWVAASFGINYLFARRSVKLFLIDGGYHTLQFTLYGLILALWH